MTNKDEHFRKPWTTPEFRRVDPTAEMILAIARANGIPAQQIMQRPRGDAEQAASAA